MKKTKNDSQQLSLFSKDDFKPEVKKDMNNLRPMTEEEFLSIDWHRGNMVKLTNGKEYLCKKVIAHGRALVLYSEEFDSKFTANHEIVACRTSDYAEPEEVYLKHKAEKRAMRMAKHKAEMEEHHRLAEERKQANLKKQEEAHAQKLAQKAKRQQELEAERQKKLAEKTELPKVEVPKVDQQVPDAPKKAKRPRIRIARTLAEKVQFPKKNR